MHHLISKALTLLALLAAHTATRAGQPPEISIHGDTYRSACSPQEWPAVRQAIQQSAQGKQPEVLIEIVKNFLCGTGEVADSRLRGSMPPRVAVLSEETGTQGQKKVNKSRTEFSALAGAAWQASVQRVGSTVSLSYLPNEACAATANFRFNGQGWQFVSFGEACD